MKFSNLIVTVEIMQSRIYARSLIKFSKKIRNIKTIIA